MVLERGDIQFFFRPTVQPAEAVEVVLGVQSLFLILSPAAAARGHRRIRIGKKRMPENPRERFWARVERVGSLQRVLGDELESTRYTTKTRGERYAPGARPIAHGTYELLQHDDHVHLRYWVEPVGLDAVPEEVAVPETGDHLVLFERDPSRERGGAIWTQRGSIDQLDAEGEELVLVGPPQPHETEGDDEHAPATL